MTPLLYALLESMNDLRARGTTAPDRAGRIYAPDAPRLELDTRLCAAAQAHAEDLRDRHYFAHASLEGVLAAQRVESRGVQWRLVGELLSGGIAGTQDVLAGWVASPEHCASLMDHRFSHIGLGQAEPGALIVVVLAALA